MNKWKYLSAAGLVAIAMFEGYQAAPYKDTGGVWTDGFGNTKNVSPQKSVTVPQALKQLDENTKATQAAISKCVTGKLTQGQFDALVSFAYNVGTKAACESTAVKRFNEGRPVDGCNELSRWVYVNGKKVAGLAARREQERHMCLEGLQ